MKLILDDLLHGTDHQLIGLMKKHEKKEDDNNKPAITRTLRRHWTLSTMGCLIIKTRSTMKRFRLQSSGSSSSKMICFASSCNSSASFIFAESKYWVSK